VAPWRGRVQVLVGDARIVRVVEYRTVEEALDAVAQ
jgi:hypothetical protein